MPRGKSKAHFTREEHQEFGAVLKSISKQLGQSAPGLWAAYNLNSSQIQVFDRLRTQVDRLRALMDQAAREEQHDVEDAWYYPLNISSRED